MWKEVFEDTRERPNEVPEDYGLETDEQEEEKKADDGSKVGDANLEQKEFKAKVNKVNRKVI